MTARLLAVLVSVAVFAGAAVPAAANGTQPPRAALSGPVCETAADALNRVVSVTSTMRPMPGTQAMKLRFVLLQRTPGHVFRVLRGGDLGRWRQAQTPSETWILTKLVANLPAPAVYRFRVNFVWLGRYGSILGAQTLFSPTCMQPR